MPVCEDCGDETEELHLTTDGHSQGANVMVCDGCYDRGMMRPEADALNRWMEKANELRELTENLEWVMDNYPRDREARRAIEEAIHHAPSVLEDLHELSHEVEEEFDV
jgi:ribosome-binding protein aMBF1 (putative translation factor)